MCLAMSWCVCGCEGQKWERREAGSRGRMTQQSHNYYSFSLSYCDLAGICFVCVVLQTEGSYQVTACEQYFVANCPWLLCAHSIAADQYSSYVSIIRSGIELQHCSSTASSLLHHMTACHISAIKCRGYYLFHHVIYCGYYLKAATNRRRRLLNPA